MPEQTFGPFLSRRKRQRKQFQPAPATRATRAMPGTPAKIAVLRARFSRREDLWHEDDAQLPRQRPVYSLEQFTRDHD